MSTTTEPLTNRYAGPCVRCGAKIPAGAGQLLRSGDTIPGDPSGCHLVGFAAVHHGEDECKTTTVTWRKFVSARNHVLRLAEMDAVWTDAGMKRPVMMYQVQDGLWGYGPNRESIRIGGDDFNHRRQTTIRVTKGHVTVEAEQPAHESGVEGERAKLAIVQELLGRFA